MGCLQCCRCAALALGCAFARLANPHRATHRALRVIVVRKTCRGMGTKLITLGHVCQGQQSSYQWSAAVLDSTNFGRVEGSWLCAMGQGEEWHACRGKAQRKAVHGPEPACTRANRQRLTAHKPRNNAKHTAMQSNTVSERWPNEVMWTGVAEGISHTGHETQTSHPLPWGVLWRPCETMSGHAQVAPQVLYGAPW